MKSTEMKTDVTVKVANGLATYRIQMDRPGIYSARLQSFEGKPQYKPAESITLVRGVRSWTGSSDDSELLNALGQFVETDFKTVNNQ